MTYQSTTTHSAAQSPHKPHRVGLYASWLLAAALVGAWTVCWHWLGGEAERRLDAGAAYLRASGWQVSWNTRRLSGYPFQLRIDLTDLSLADPSGLSVAAPELEGRAFPLVPTRWRLDAPEGLTITRPGAGLLEIGARRIRAILSDWARRPLRISLEGDDVTFDAPQGATPFPLLSANGLRFELRPRPQDQASLSLGLDGGVPLPASWLGRIAQGEPVGLTVNAIVTHARAFSGADWRAAVRSWSQHGGSLLIRQLTLRADGGAFDADRGDLAVGANGRLQGVLDASVNEPRRVLAALTGFGATPPVQPKETPEPMRLTLARGWTWMGSERLAPAPSVF
jgi:hypothetical protein